MSQKFIAINYPIVVEGRLIYTYKDKILYGGKGQRSKIQAEELAINYIPSLKAITHTNYRRGHLPLALNRGRTVTYYKLVGGTLKKTIKKP